MKVRVTLKDPDTMYDDVLEAVKREVAAIQGIDDGERRLIRDERQGEVTGIISNTWMRYGEYLTVEFDTDAMTATVLLNNDTE